MTIDNFEKKNAGGVLGPEHLLDRNKEMNWVKEGVGKCTLECSYLFKKHVWCLHLFTLPEMPAIGKITQALIEEVISIVIQ